MFIDIHSHINNEVFENEIEGVISRAKEAGVLKIVCVGCDLESSKSAISLANRFDCVYAAIGLHPNAAFEFSKEAEELIFSAASNKKIVAIGEIGLDYHDFEWQIDQARRKDPSLGEISKEDFILKQKEVFIKQIELANKLNLPVMIHMREATNETLNILEQNRALLSSGGLMHCFNGSLETTMRVFDLGFYISLGGAITFKNSRTMPEVLEEIGLSRVTLETDCPYLSPEPFRGKRNEPKNIPIIAKKIADLTFSSLKEVETKTTQNALCVFPRLQ